MSFNPSPARGGVLKVKISSTFTAMKGVMDIPELGNEKTIYERAYIDSTLPSVFEDLIQLAETTWTGDVDLKGDAAQAAVLAAYAAGTTLDLEVDFISGAKATFSAKVKTFKISGKGAENEMFSFTLKNTTEVAFTAAP